MKNLKIFILSILLIFVIAIIYFGLNFAPGSYPLTKRYNFNVSEAELIRYIKEVKEVKPELKVPEDYGMLEGRRSEDDYWYHFYIYYSDDKEILNCWVRANSTKSTDLAFVSIRDKYGKWKSLDSDMDNSEIEEQTKKFENRFLNYLKKLTQNNENF